MKKLAQILLIKIIQGGMGVSISTWLLARLVSLLGGLGTVSGVGAERILAYILQDGDPDGHFRRALKSLALKYPKLSKSIELVLKEYYIEGGKSRGKNYKKVEKFSMNPSVLLIALTVFGNYCLVWLAKEGHDKPISINWLEKVQLPHVYSITGAMLADVDVITMGAGLPYQIPDVLNALVKGENPSYRISIENAKDKTIPDVNNLLTFDLVEFFSGEVPKFEKPAFFPIVSNQKVARILLSRCPENSIRAFIVENVRAAGHNPKPSGKQVLDGEPVYGPKDECDFEELKKLGIPFWIGGSLASPEGLAYALSVEAQGIQAGTIFELTDESGLREDLKKRVRKEGYNGTLIVKNLSFASPTGYPFNEALLKGTLSEDSIYGAVIRDCICGYLCTLFVKPDGTIGYRCPSDNVKIYLKSGGKLEDTIGKQCLCTALFSNAGFLLKGKVPAVTGSKEYSFLKNLMKHEDDSYSVEEVMKYLLSKKI